MGTGWNKICQIVVIGSCCRQCGRRWDCERACYNTRAVNCAFGWSNRDFWTVNRNIHIKVRDPMIYWYWCCFYWTSPLKCQVFRNLSLAFWSFITRTWYPYETLLQETSMCPTSWLIHIYGGLLAFWNLHALLNYCIMKHYCTEFFQKLPRT